MHIRKVYNEMIDGNIIEENKYLELYLMKHKVRSLSGVIVITIFTSPYPTYFDEERNQVIKQPFSCKNNCYYCPKQPNMPKSYLLDEPGVLRGHHNNWDPISQFYDRANMLYNIGHNIDKIEIIILGGTWSQYPIQYQYEFIRDIYYSANTFGVNNDRDKYSLEMEQTINETNKCKIIGLTIETRPDNIDLDEIKRLREYGCTRVQLGVQHTNDDILKYINRGCTNNDAIKAVKLLKNCGFKIDFHLMPDLPGSNMVKDMNMFKYILNSEDMQADQWKVYPCQITPYTRIKKWYDAGEYTPYKYDELVRLLIWMKCHVPPWIRLNRVVRDIPDHYVHGSNTVINLRQHILAKMKEYGFECKCVRCREVGAYFRNESNERIGKDLNDDSEVELKERKYMSSGGIEYFISFESKDEKVLYGFVRLRIPKTTNDDTMYDYFPELNGCGLIRELHVYGKMIKVGDEVENIKDKQFAQHIGLGMQLMFQAECIAKRHGMDKMSVIAGIGTREYYKKMEYTLNGSYMIKWLN